jgi:PAS domain S-box-containing protein
MAMLERRDLALDSETSSASERGRTGATTPGALRAAFLESARRALSEPVDLEATLDRVARLAVPELADACFVDLFEPNGDVRRVVVAHADPAAGGIAQVLHRHVSSATFEATRALAAGSLLIAPADGVASSPEPTGVFGAAIGRAKIVLGLRARETAIGVLTLLSGESGRRFGVDDLVTAEELARYAASAIDDARRTLAASRAIEQATRATAHATHVDALGAALASSGTVAGVAAALVSRTMAALGADRGLVALRAADRDPLEVVAAQEGEQTRSDACASEEEVDAMERAMRDTTPLFIAGARAREPRDAAPLTRGDPDGARSRAAVPLVADGRTLGALSLAWKTARALDEDDRALLATLAGTGALALDRACLASELSAARDALAHAEERHRALAESVPAIVWVTGEGSALEYANRRFAQYTGARDAHAGRDWVSAVHPDHVARYMTAWEDARRTGHPSELEFLVRRSDGTYRWHLTRLVPERPSAGGATRWLGIATDIDDAKRAQESLRLLADASTALFSSLDYETTLVAVAHLAVPDFADECSVEVVSQSGAVERVASTFDDAAREGDPRHALAANVLRTGVSQLESVVVEPELVATGLRSYIAVPLVAHGKVLGALSFLMTDSGRSYDEDDRAVAEDLARRAGQAVENALRFRDAQAASRARDDLLAVVSHDLRNPLNVIAASSSMLARGGAGDDLEHRARRSADIILRAVGRMDRLIADLLDVSQIEAHRLSIYPEEHEITALVTEAGEMLRPLAAQKSQALDVEACAPHVVRCDRERILQVIANLVGNSIKFTPSGGRLALRVESLGDRVRLTVTDEGPGIPEDALGRVFDRYWRAHNATREGTGLGLSIAKALVLAHGGEIGVTSTLGVGTTFFFTLPLILTKAAPEPGAIPSTR